MFYTTLQKEEKKKQEEEIICWFPFRFNASGHLHTGIRSNKYISDTSMRKIKFYASHTKITLRI